MIIMPAGKTMMIIPSGSRQQRDCTVIEGKRYCREEKISEGTQDMLAIGFLLAVVIGIVVAVKTWDGDWFYSAMIFMLSLFCTILAQLILFVVICAVGQVLS